MNFSKNSETHTNTLVLLFSKSAPFQRLCFLSSKLHHLLAIAQASASRRKLLPSELKLSRRSVVGFYHMAVVLPAILVANTHRGHVGGGTLPQSDIANKDKVQILGTGSNPSKMTSVSQ